MSVGREKDWSEIYGKKTKRRMSVGREKDWREMFQKGRRKESDGKMAWKCGRNDKGKEGRELRWD